MQHERGDRTLLATPHTSARKSYFTMEVENAIAGSSSLFVHAPESSWTVSLNPGVVLSIIDHYSRRSDNTKPSRVLGTLLGVVHEDERVIDIRSCFPVPHSETEDSIALDMEFHRVMFDLLQRVNPLEQVVGWYSTGNDINRNSILVHDFYGKEVAQPVQLLVDTSLSSVQSSLAVRAVVSSAQGNAGRSFGSQFQEVQVKRVCSEAEQVALDQLIASARADGTAAAQGQASTLIPDMVALENAVANLLEMLERTSAYVNDVVEGKQVGDKNIGRFLADAVAEVPKVQANVFERLFENGLLDMLMVLYLSSLTRTQLTLAEKLQNELNK